MKAYLQIIFGIMSIAVTASADVLEMKDGKSLNGKYVGGTGTSIRFETAEGVQVYETSKIVALTFTGQQGQAAGQVAEPAGAAAPAAAAPGATAAAQTQPAGQTQARSVTVPAGTTLVVRLMDTVSSESPSGSSFSTRLEYDLTADGVTALKAGTPIKGTITSAQAGRLRGQSFLDLRLNQISADGQQIAIATGGHQTASEASIRKAARGAAGGAAIGAIAGDAGKGAAIGSVVGAAKKPKAITVPSGTLLEFQLTQPFTVQAVK